MRRNFTARAAARQIANEHCALTKTKQLEQKLSKKVKNALTDTGKHTHNYAVVCIIFNPYGIEHTKTVPARADLEARGERADLQPG